MMGSRNAYCGSISEFEFRISNFRPPAGQKLNVERSTFGRFKVSSVIGCDVPQWTTQLLTFSSLGSSPPVSWTT